jgi:hypothetical protein
MSQNDKVINSIVDKKKGSHKHMVNVRDVMECDIGKNQKALNSDLS